MGGRERRNGRSNGGSHVPPPWLSGWFDPELRDLFHEEPELYEVAHRLRAARPEVTPDPQYRTRLRAALMAEAAQRRGARRSGVLRRWLVPRPTHFAFGGAAVGAALIAATVLTVFVGGRAHDHEQVVWTSTLTAQHSVSPDNVITVSFNQPMDHAAVVAGLHIQPATQVTTAWVANQLVITPVHHLAGNTPYTVRIDQQNLRSASGVVAAAPLAITFGTAPTPPAAPGSSTPQLATTTLGPADGKASVLFAPGGSVVVTSSAAAGSTPASTPTPAASALASPSASASASPSASPSASASATATPAASGSSVVQFGSSPIALGPAATAAAFAPRGGAFAAAIPSDQGGSDIAVSLSDGTQTSNVLHVPDTVVALTWSSNDRIVYATAGAVGWVTLTGSSGTTAQAPAAGTIVALAPGGGTAYLHADGSAGTLWNIGSGATRTLTGSGADVAFSADGRSVAWADSAGGRLLVSPVDRDAPVAIASAYPGASLHALALNADASEIAYLAQPQSGAHLVLAQVATGTVLALGPPAQQAVFSSGGDALALLVPSNGGMSVERAAVPGMATAAQTVPATAISVLNTFVAAQVQGNQAALTPLSGTDVGAASATPGGLTRAYVIDTSVARDGAVHATVTLVVDPSSQHPTAQVASEDLVLTSSSGGTTYLVTSLHVGALRDQASGPHVTQISLDRGTGTTTIAVSFDSDLDASTVAGALSVTDASGTTIPITATYDANTRTAVITLQGSPQGPYTVQVSTSLHDVDGTALAAAFSGAVDG